MCGRYLITSTPEAMRALFKYLEQPNFPPRYNVAPTQPIPIVRLHEGRRQFALVRWGLIPAWVKDPKGFSLILQARSDSVVDKPSFKNAMRRRRCLVPADGFYEWNEAFTPRRPYAVLPRAGGPVAFAGLWETWMGPNGEELETAAIVTTRANRSLGEIHERMPVVVPPDAFNLWLDCGSVDVETAMTLVTPAPDAALEAYEVSTAVNRTANDNPKLVERWSPPAEPGPEQKPAPRKQPARRTKKDDGQGVLF
jgi:putative SOS response-associated peptidase YedK